MVEMRRMFIDEKEFVELSNIIIDNLDKSPFIRENPIVLGLLNGGKNLADYISDALKLPIRYMSIHSREGDPGNLGISGTKGTVDMSISVDLLKSDKPFLIVDDIYDSGLTMTTIQRLFPLSRSCVLIHKSPDRYSIKTDFYGKFVPPDVWIDFFWEK